jgi:hypothetical protein
MPPKAAKLFHLDLDMLQWVETQAKDRRISQAQVIRDLILEAMRKTPNPPAESQETPK